MNNPPSWQTQKLTGHLLPNSSSNFSFSCWLSKELRTLSPLDLDPRLMVPHKDLPVDLKILGAALETKCPFYTNRIQEVFSQGSFSSLFSVHIISSKQEMANRTSLTPTFLLSLSDGVHKWLCDFHFWADAVYYRSHPAVRSPHSHSDVLFLHFSLNK